MAGEMVAKKKTAKAAKRGKGKAAKRGEEAPAHERFREIAHGEHREVRDILLALYDAFGKRNLKRAKTLHAEFCAHCGPHFRYEEEALHPLLEPIVGKVQVEHLNREHDRAIVDTIYMGRLTSEKRLNADEGRQGQRLVRRILPHVSDCDGLAVMVEKMADADVETILAARQAALKDNIALLEWASETRLRSFRDTYKRDFYATRQQARGFG
ncbi:MAG: hemerythrin domain-containing protein [Alphaproteobacteria bacterium]|nr:hemerythrin domain-containing protein [Alphaproteobacteria bacterium]MDP6589175.1 hemerythrin domain-containing protein [Alphaproteobacteria bacterium]MDP6818432.1 hemerythrin domain-containing protein [Alphaproteobacteria bacterium]|tara:strand:- start:978 stop:1613 length:636 start_codon:yes stop_codon:yes gene_type:complete